MWMSRQLAEGARARREEGAQAELGVITVGAERASVRSCAEERSLPLFGPAGIAWIPAAGETVLVVKGGSGRNESCIAGAEMTQVPEDLRPGELYLFSAGASIRLGNDGRIEIRGQVSVNGIPWGETAEE